MMILTANVYTMCRQQGQDLWRGYQQSAAGGDEGEVAAAQAKRAGLAAEAGVPAHAGCTETEDAGKSG